MITCNLSPDILQITKFFGLRFLNIIAD